MKFWRRKVCGGLCRAININTALKLHPVLASKESPALKLFSNIHFYFLILETFLVSGVTRV
jgi:hypothetical protein